MNLLYGVNDSMKIAEEMFFKGYIDEALDLMADAVNTLQNIINESKQKEIEYLSLFKAGIKLLEDDYLGGSGSRGYGQIKITLNEPEHKTIETYLNERV